MNHAHLARLRVIFKVLVSQTALPIPISSSFFLLSFCTKSCIARGKKEKGRKRVRANYKRKICWNFADPAQISELLSKTIADAHARTCLVSTEQIQESFRKPHDLTRLIYYKNMAHEQLWLECAQKLTTVIQQIIEFAKMVPGFMKLSQDDQIVLLKAGT